MNRLMFERVDVLWLSRLLQSAEHCTIRPWSRPATVESTTLLAYKDVPARIEYTISVNGEWETERVSLELAAADHQVTLALVREDGWLVNGTPRPDLDACIDVDLGWTPATNMLPLRRMALDVGQSVTTTAAWVRFPDLDVVPSEQTYTRLADDRVLYKSNAFEAELVVTPDGLVTTYGNDLWEAATLHRQ